MKNIAIINVMNIKSTGKIALNLLNQLTDKGYNVTFFYGRGEKSNDPRQIRFESRFEVLVHAFLSRLTGLQGFFSCFATRRLVKEMKKRNTDTVILLNPHAYYLNERVFYSYVSKSNLRFIYIVPDEYAFLGKCSGNPGCERFKTGKGKCPNIHRYPESWLFDTCPIVMKGKEKNYKNINRAKFVGPEFVINHLKQSFLGQFMPTAVLDEAIDISLYQPRDAKKLRQELGISEEKVIILCIAPPYKKIEYFKQVAEKLKYNEKYIFIHVGKDDAVTQGNYIHVNFVKENSDLALYYSMADLFLFTSMGDTMSNACLEALACGTPLLTFNISGMPYLMDNSVGTMVEPGNVEQLVKIVEKTEKKTPDIMKRCRTYAEGRYDMNKYSDKLLDIAKGIK